MKSNERKRVVNVKDNGLKLNKSILRELGNFCKNCYSSQLIILKQTRRFSNIKLYFNEK